MILHNEIMNISARPDPDVTAIYKIAYKQGHRDARHAAAEMSLRLEAQRDQLREALEKATNIIDKMGDMPDRKICPIVWRDLECGGALEQARAALRATEEG